MDLPFGKRTPLSQSLSRTAAGGHFNTPPPPPISHLPLLSHNPVYLSIILLWLYQGRCLRANFTLALSSVRGMCARVNACTTEELQNWHLTKLRLMTSAVNNCFMQHKNGPPKSQLVPSQLVPFHLFAIAFQLTEKCLPWFSLEVSAAFYCITECII